MQIVVSVTVSIRRQQVRKCGLIITVPTPAVPPVYLPTILE
jgi:hypothetical protein